jgi:hypothetical protein
MLGMEEDKKIFSGDLEKAFLSMESILGGSVIEMIMSDLKEFGGILLGIKIELVL